MKTFEAHFSENEILRQICKIRVKIAKNKSKKHLLHLLTRNQKYNYHLSIYKKNRNDFEEYQAELIKLLSSILPPRKKWVKLGEGSRRKFGRKNEFLTSNDKNFYSLLKTIKKHETIGSNEEWFLNLKIFIQEVQELAVSEEYKVKKPIIFPKLKDSINRDGQNECRPICIFPLKDRIILSLANKFLTQLFDKYFQNSSYAFRAERNKEGEILSHHDCIKDILRYKNSQSSEELYVVECDMKKFYDTVNHKIISQLFNKLVSKEYVNNPALNIEAPIRIFKSYLNCYAFNIDVPKSTDTTYWDSYNIPNGEFTWIEDSDLSLYYEKSSTERIGVPQGGALSGLIANIYLNKADIALSHTKVLYQRFCDDMIIIHNNFEECNEAKDIYVSVLKDLKLFPHDFKSTSELIDKSRNKLNYKPFWKGKSKGVYKWGRVSENSFPWIGFVGYEINVDGEIRIRKKSFLKELTKQKVIIKEIESAIKIGMRKPKGTATESAINRLIGMSVGRIGLNNFDEVSTDLCWKNGFRELTINKHSIRQIKQFDRNRNKLYYRFLKNANNPKLDVEIEPRQIIYYNKPFSYYYQVLERKKSI